jgi:hypothetical protein
VPSQICVASPLQKGRRGFALEPRSSLNIADEGVSASNVSVRARLLELLRKLQREFGVTKTVDFARHGCDPQPKVSATKVVKFWALIASSFSTYDAYATI